MSAELKTMKGVLPPSSSESRLSVPAHRELKEWGGGGEGEERKGEEREKRGWGRKREGQERETRGKDKNTKYATCPLCCLVPNHPPLPPGKLIQ